MRRACKLELLGPTIDWIEFSALLPVGLEMTCFWESILDRMTNDRCETDWNEQNMAEYLWKFILGVEGDDVFNSLYWLSL